MRLLLDSGKSSLRIALAVVGGVIISLALVEFACFLVYHHFVFWFWPGDE